MTDDSDFENNHTPFETPLEAALKALKKMKDDPNSGDQVERISRAVNILTLGIREIKHATQNLRNKEIR